MTTASSSGCLPQRTPSAPGWLDHIATGLLYYYLTSLIPILGVVFGFGYVMPPLNSPSKPGSILAAFANWDGNWYKTILEYGYHYDLRVESSVVFFPGFPLLGRLANDLLGCGPDLALLIVAHLCLAGSFVVLAAYVHRRYGPCSPNLVAYILLAFGLFPVTFFFRMAYSESLFVLSTLIALYAMQMRWPLPVIAAIVGLSTAVRPVGVALLVPLFLQIWATRPTLAARLRQAILLASLACWGIAAYMVYQQLAFAEPLAFVKAQARWCLRPPVPLAEKLQSLVLLEPIWSVYAPSSPAYWERNDRFSDPVFSMLFLNPLYFLVAIALVIVGGAKGWLTRNELALAVGLLLIPYVTRSHEMCMASMGRFAAAAFPLYLVLGQSLYRLPRGLAAGLLSVSGFFLAIYAALFACGYFLF